MIGGPSGVTLRLLGAVAVGDGQGNGFPDLEGRQKRISVLAYLGAALPYGFHRRDKLLGQFWADMSQSNARRALNQSLLVLRDALGRDAILSRGDAEIAINEEFVRVDVREFDSAMDRGEYETAIELYQGDFLDGFYIPGAPEFERWADQERTRLRHAALKAAFTLVGQYEKAGEYLGAVELSRWAVRMAPLDEGVFRQYLELLDRHGDRSSALREYTAFVERLADDYGVDPSPETQALIGHIRSRVTPRSGPAVVPVGDIEQPNRERDELLELLRRSLAGKYDVFEEIGHGGMAVVFRGNDLTLDREVAIKVLRPELARSIGADRFLQEIKVEAAIEHPNVIAVYDSGNAEGVPFYVMQLFEGETLRGRMKRERQLPIDDAIAITRDVATALQAAHDKGYVHRDIKPENILLKDGRAVVSDFGIARALAEAGAAEFTVTGVTIGTPGYMSPEQGTADVVDHRSDQYALACVLYEMFTGEMVFAGPTARAIIAKHVSWPIPSVTVLRSTVPTAVDKVVGRALNKSPADRFSSVTEMGKALERALVEPSPPEPPPTKRVIATVGVIALATIAAWNLIPRPAMLDQNRIIGFPLVETSVNGLGENIGEILAYGIGTALEETAPLKWDDGWRALTPAQRDDIAGVSDEEKNAIARVKGARYRLDGSVLVRGDSASVILWLIDVADNEVLARRTVSGDVGDESAMRSALASVRNMLPSLLNPGTDVLRIPLEDRDLGAVVLWMEGKREYRASRFSTAKTLYERAFDKDSTLVMAALNAAQAANWGSDLAEAERLASLALERESYLPAPQAYLAHGLYEYVTGAADSAAMWFARALESDPSWPEARMALGEVYYHQLPKMAAPLDSLAEEEFRAAATDSNFSPPLYHLAEIAIRNGDVDRGKEFLDRFEAFAPDHPAVFRLTLMWSCVLGGPSAIDWSISVSLDALDVLSAAKSLSVGGRQPECAEAGFRAVMRDNRAQQFHWGAVLGLQAVLLGSGRRDEYMALIDSVVTYRPATMSYYLFAAILDSTMLPKALEAEAFIRRAFGDVYERSPSDQLSWTMGVWHAHRGDAPVVLSIRDRLEGRDGRQAALFAASLSGHLFALMGDTLRAIDALQAVASNARRDSLDWQVGESLPIARLVHAELLYEVRRYEEAIVVASIFDHAAPIMFPAFAPRSLELRINAARALGQPQLASRYQARLRALHSQQRG